MAGFLFSSRSLPLPLGNRKDFTMSDKTISIIFPQGGIIPASIMKADKDVHVDAHVPVTVPERYGRHLIDDRFAVEVPAAKAEEPKPVKKTAAEKAAEKAAAEEAARLAAEQAAADKVAAEKAAQIAAAEKALDEAKALLATSGADLVAKGEAEQMVAAAEAALAALQA
jgi:pyruvate/2-oxoglutarate dehydrogenase complex dihydrolipoamide acyltransferase (E2) component